MRGAGGFFFPTALALGAAGLALAAVPQNAAAQCSTSPESSGTLSVGAGVVTNAGTHPVLEGAIFSGGTTVTFRSLKDLGSTITDIDTRGTVKDYSLSSRSTDTPTPINIGDDESPDYRVFLAEEQGTVVSLNPERSSNPDFPFIQYLWRTNLQRGSCPGASGDKILGSPTLHLRRFASASFQAAYSTSLVYVGTAFGSGGSCTGADTANQVVALNAETGAVVWRFNEFAGSDVGAVLSNGFLDIENDLLYITTDKPSLSSQSTIWAIDILTGTAAWSRDIGSVAAAPVVRNSKIYVATGNGEIKALSRTDGTVVWTRSIAPPFPMQGQVFAEFRPPYADLIAAVDAFGRVALVRDDGSSSTLVWGPTALPGGSAVSRINIDPVNGKLYVGSNDRTMYQLNLVTGAAEASRTLPTVAGVGAVAVADPTFTFADSTFSDLVMVTATSDGDVASYCFPWAGAGSPFAPLTGGMSLAPEDAASLGPNEPCETASDCGDDTKCTEWRCEVGVCIAGPVNDGVECDAVCLDESQKEVPCLGTCKSGTCEGISECEQDTGACRCVPDEGGLTERQIPTSQKRDDNNDIEVLEVTTTSACVEIGSQVASAFYVHVFDQNRVPIDKAQVRFRFEGSAQPPPVLDPDSLDPLPTDEFYPAVQSERAGTYFFIVGAPESGKAGETQVIADVRLPGCGVVEQVSRTLFIREDVQGEDCPVDGALSTTGYLGITVVDAEGNPLEKADVLVGWAQEERYFYRRFESFVTGELPDSPNFGQTDEKGQISFLDFGNRLNGAPNTYNPDNDKGIVDPDELPGGDRRSYGTRVFVRSEKGEREFFVSEQEVTLQIE